jgi:peptidoglycan/xylan/chitin deacetylase (PgdA/CDA1 family)
MTVVMFHRVLPYDVQVRSGADPYYTMTTEAFAACVQFIKHNYNIVGLNDVLESLGRTKPLPKRPMLITFDDGWRDNLEWALPILGETPWTVFVASDVTEARTIWWQEVILWSLRQKLTTFEQLKELAAPRVPSLGRFDTENSQMELLVLFGRLPAPERDLILSPLKEQCMRGYVGPQMMDKNDLQTLRRRGVTIGAHGASHVPLSLLPDPESDLRSAKNALAQYGAEHAVSFPHGRYNMSTVEICRRLGYRALFTSRPVLNPCPDGWLVHDVLGRISMDTPSVADSRGEVSIPRLATWLYHRPIERVT